MIIQERQRTTLTRPLVGHKDSQRFILNTLSLHNYRILQDLLPPDIRSPRNDYINLEQQMIIHAKQAEHLRYKTTRANPKNTQHSTTSLGTPCLFIPEKSVDNGAPQLTEITNLSSVPRLSVPSPTAPPIPPPFTPLEPTNTTTDLYFGKSYRRILPYPSSASIQLSKRFTPIYAAPSVPISFEELLQLRPADGAFIYFINTYKNL